MIFSVRTTVTVILTVILSAVFTLVSASEAQSETSITITREGSHSFRVQGPPVLNIATPVAIPSTFSTTAQSATASIVTTPPPVSAPQSSGRAQGMISTAVAVPSGTMGAVIAFAMAQLGDPYVWGGNGPNGWDCSGLMVGAYQQIGVNLPRTSRAQFTVGSPVAYGQWIPGDLLFYGSSAGSIHHVVMYIGGGQIVHAPQAGDVVKVAAAPHGGGSDYLAAKRIV